MTGEPEADGPILVSACLAGMHCRYDGRARTDERVRTDVEAGRAIPVCPEMLAGLPAPRPPAEIVGGDGTDVLDGTARVLDADGTDLTDHYLAGARRTLAIARAAGASSATLQERSPSCGSGQRYDGSFTGSLTAGAGVTTALLRRNAITVRAANAGRRPPPVH
jgi:uncharacterized protein YbbK (DUF523 family)